MVLSLWLAIANTARMAVWLTKMESRLQENLVAATFTNNQIAAAKAILSKDMPIIVISSGTEVKVG